MSVKLHMLSNSGVELVACLSTQTPPAGNGYTTTAYEFQAASEPAAKFLAYHIIATGNGVVDTQLPVPVGHTDVVGVVVQNLASKIQMSRRL